jgi:hypothetical protein
MAAGTTSCPCLVRAYESARQFSACVNEYLPEPLANDFRINGAKSWPEVEKVLQSL